MNEPNMYRVNYKETFVYKGWRNKRFGAMPTNGMGLDDVWADEITQEMQADIPDLHELCEYAHSPREIVSVFPIYIEIDDKPIKQEQIDMGKREGATKKLRKRREAAVQSAVDELARARAELGD